MKRFTPDKTADTVLTESIVRALIGETATDDRNAYWREGARVALEIEIRILLAQHPGTTTPDDTEVGR